MRSTILSAIVIATFAASVAAQPVDQRQGPEPPPLPSTPEATPQRVTVPLSDPARPGSLEIDIVMGSIAVKGTNRRDVLIEAQSTSNPRPPRRRAPEEPPPAGPRRLTRNPPFSVEEDKNTVSIEVAAPTRSIDFTIEVPLRTNL